MGSPWIQNSGIIPTDNFKIQPNLILQKPFGIFVEEIMFWIQQERARLGMQPSQFSLYDEWNPDSADEVEGEPSEPVALHPGCTKELPSDFPDTQGVGFIPGAIAPETAFSGFYPFIINPMQDIVNALISVGTAGDPFKDDRGLLQMMNMVDGSGFTAQLSNTLSDLLIGIPSGSGVLIGTQPVSEPVMGLPSGSGEIQAS